MALNINFIDSILIISLPETYTAVTISEVMSLVESKEKMEKIHHIIVDCEKLKYLESFGGEIFLLRKNYDIRNFVFCELEKSLESIVNEFSTMGFGENIRTFAKKEDAIKFVSQSSNNL